jgi:nitroreductase
MSMAGTGTEPEGASDGAATGGARSSVGVLDTRSSIDVLDAIQRRRTHKEFTDAPVTREQVELLLDAAVLAPNHKLTEPWRFLVLGANAKRRLGATRASVKCGPEANGEEPKVAERRAAIIARTAAIPAILAVVMREDHDAERREEDYAATFMAVQNMLLAGEGLGLGTKVATGAVLRESALREMLGLRDSERCVAIVHVGRPAEQRPMKPRTPAAQRTTWLD